MGVGLLPTFTRTFLFQCVTLSTSRFTLVRSYTEFYGPLSAAVSERRRFVLFATVNIVNIVFIAVTVSKWHHQIRPTSTSYQRHSAGE